LHPNVKLYFKINPITFKFSGLWVKIKVVWGKVAIYLQNSWVKFAKGYKSPAKNAKKGYTRYKYYTFLVTTKLL
jgi:hypothetical protein